MASSLRVNSIIPSSGTNVAIGTAGGAITYNANVTGVSTFSSGIVVSVGSTEALRTDSNSNIGIKTTSTSGFNGACDDVVISGSSSPGLTFHSTTTTGTGSIAFTDAVGSTTQGAINYVHNGDYMIFQTNASEKVRIDSTGRVIKPNQPAFSVYPASSPIGSGTVIFTQVRFNIGSHYSTSTGRFTAPIDGMYLIILTVQHSGATSTNGYIDIQKNGGDLNARYESITGATFEAGGISAIVQMSAGDYITIVASANVFHDDSTNFSGYFLG